MIYFSDLKVDIDRVNKTVLMVGMLTFDPVSMTCFNSWNIDILSFGCDALVSGMLTFGHRV